MLPKACPWSFCFGMHSILCLFRHPAPSQPSTIIKPTTLERRITYDTNSWLSSGTPTIGVTGCQSGWIDCTITGGSGGTSTVGITGTLCGSNLKRLQDVRGLVWRHWHWRSHCHSDQRSKDCRGDTHCCCLKWALSGLFQFAANSNKETKKRWLRRLTGATFGYISQHHIYLS